MIRLGLDPWGIEKKKGTFRMPQTISLSQNTANRFKAQTVISFALPKTSFVKLEVYNTLGQRVRTLVDSPMKAGKHSAIWDGRDEQDNHLASGIYLYRLEVGGKFAQARKMLLLR